MQLPSSLHEQAKLWVTQKFSNAEHLVRAEEWVLQLQPNASEALQLAALANPTLANDKLNGLSFTGFYGEMAGKVGTKLNESKVNQASHAQLLTQAEAFREHLSSVSLDEEALHLLEFQRAYEASARMVSVLDEMLQTAVNIGRS